MTRQGRLVPAALACLVVGSGVMLAFESALARVVGVALLVAWVVIGAFAVASPDTLSGEEDREP